MTETDSSYFYLSEFTAPNLPDSLTEGGNEPIGTCDPKIDSEGATVSFVGSQGTIRSIVESYGKAGLSPELHKLGEIDRTGRAHGPPARGSQDSLRNGLLQRTAPVTDLLPETFADVDAVLDSDADDPADD